MSRTLRPTRTVRAAGTQYLLAAAVSVLALTVSACNGGGTSGTNGEGAQGAGTSDSRPAVSSPASASPASSSSTSAAPSADKQTPGTSGTSGTSGSGGTDDTPRAQTKSPAPAATTAAPAPAPAAKRVTCTNATTRATLSPVTRPINHLLLTVTNTGSTACDAYGAPLLGFDGDQSTVRILDDSKPQAVVTLAPGESAYASIGLSGDGDNGHRVTGLRLFFQGRAMQGSVGAVKNLSLPGGSAYVDSSDWVSYWQFSMADALTY